MSETYVSLAGSSPGGPVVELGDEKCCEYQSCQDKSLE